MTISRVAVIGAGTMGNGISQACAGAGLDVVMVDVSAEAVKRGLGTVSSSLDRLVKKEKMTAAQKDQLLARIKGTTNYADIAKSDLVIEAATENLSVKLRILKQIEDVVGQDCIVATNTSSISITQMAATLKVPTRFIGLHFFNPVPLMALVELICGLQTSDQTHDSVKSLAVALGKSPITVKNRPGFVVNRILCPMINEAIFALDEGIATAEDIDAGMKLGCNHPIGPLALADLIGLDTLLSIMEVFLEGFNDPRYRPAPMLREMVAAGYLGRKSGRGFYQY
jgi:3-hydroxybutyryl-CoA dehydrogenase